MDRGSPGTNFALRSSRFCLARTTTVLARVLVCSIAYIASAPIEPVFAQALPPAEFCISGGCYPTHAEALAALAASQQYTGVGQYLQHTFTSVTNPLTGQLSLRYDVLDRPAKQIADPIYTVDMGVHGQGNPGCAAPQDPNYSTYCTNEGELITAALAHLRTRIKAGCSLDLGKITRDYNTTNLGLSGNAIRYGQKDFSSETTCTASNGTVTKGKLNWSTYKRRLISCEPGLSPNFGGGWTDSELPQALMCGSSADFSFMSARASQISSCSTANPCHPTTGDKTRTETDFIFAGRPFSRHYHSLAQFRDRENPFAVGWSHSYSDYLVSTDTYSPVLIDAEGNYENFVKVDGNIYRGANSNRTMFYLNTPDVQYRLMESSGEMRDFNRDGALLSIRNPANPSNDVKLSYSEEELASVTDASGRQIKFNYAFDLLRSITLPDGEIINYEHDRDLNLTAVDYGDGSVKRYHYHEQGLAEPSLTHHLTGITSEDGRRYGTFKYEPHGRVTRSALESGSEQVDAVSLSYDSPTTTSVTYALGEKKTFTAGSGLYRSLENLSSESGSDKLTYFADGRLQSKTDRAGTVTKYEYQATYLSAIIQAAGTAQQQREEFVRDVASNALLEHRIYDPKGKLRQSNVFTYNARGQRIARTQTDAVSGVARTSRNEYCEQAAFDAGSCPILGLITLSDGARTDVPDTTTYTYYGNDDSSCAGSPATCPHRKGDLWKVTNALGQVIEYLAYDGAGRPLSIKDVDGNITDYSYHRRGWLTATKVRGADPASDLDDRITRIGYWPTGLIKQVAQPDGGFTTFGYDGAHRLTDVTDNAGNTLHYTLDSAGNRIKEDTRDVAGTLKRTLSRVYNQLGQLKTQATAASDPTDFAYDAKGNTVAVNDALGTATLSDYDALDRLARTLQDANGIKAETKFAYDYRGNLAKVTDPKGLGTTYEYNGFGDLTKLVSPDTGITAYTYDSAGNRASQTDARGVITTYSYDALNRLTKLTYPKPTDGLDISYTYDTLPNICVPGEASFIGRLARMSDGSGSTEYCYNAFGDVTRKVQTSNATALVLRYDYTVGGRLRRVTYPDGAVVDYVRNAQGQSTEVGVTPAGGSRQVLLGSASYYPFGPAAGWTYGNGRTLTRLYDLDYRPQAIQDTRPGGLEVGFGFDPVGNLTALTPAGNAVPEISLDYDTLGRLTALTDGVTGTVIDGYSYDATGNRLSAKVGTVTQAYTYPTTNHRLSAVAGVARTYDKTGNTLTIGGKSREFSYDASGRMSMAKRAGALVMNYRYNGRGEQVRRFLGTTNTYTLYDEAGHWLGDYDSNGAPKQQAIWLDDLPVGLLANANTLHYIEPDHLGSPRVMVDPTRDVAVWTWSLKGEAFGNTAPNQDPDGDGAALVLDMRFPGQRFDVASGLNQNYFRDYDAATGRYGQSDPIGLSGGSATFSYVSSDPYKFSDSLGLINDNQLPSQSQIQKDYQDQRRKQISMSQLTQTYQEMLKKNVRGTDQFFHCLAACKATKASGDSQMVLDQMQNKEIRDFALNLVGKYGDRELSIDEMLSDNAADMAVNKIGATCPAGVDCSSRCSPLLDNLPLARRKFMLEYRPDWGK
ncbi:RHS repeat-associated core domain-containing protein [Xanthomonas campestris]|uniref:RHS repeat-associated core domain-containing protein n=1 Tax=Xanthomonas campestris TaxID=339 RepID=UPI002006E090|nr:RHS repeat-associated core domain-containing protein [Xanthomonas campestris]